MDRLLNRLRFLVERWIQGGAWNQLLMMAAIIGIVSIIGGALAWILSASFGNFGDALWWSFLRLSDPGYLGEDEGAVLRTISTVITVLGYVLFLGSLIAIMTQWLNGTIRRLESGLSPITVSGHILILGWTNRSPNLLRELVDADLTLSTRQRTRPPRIVILANEVTPALRHEVRDALGDQYDRWRVILRSGSALRIEHLRRVDYERAATIIIPGSDFSIGGYESSDARVVKTLITIAHHIDLTGRTTDLPRIVAEILDISRHATVEGVYDGPLQAIASDALVSRLIAQNLRHPGLSSIYAELLTHSAGNEIYSANFPQLAGETFAAVSDRFPEAVLIGIVRPSSGAHMSLLNPDPDFVLNDDDYCIGIARSRQSLQPSEATVSPIVERITHLPPIRRKDRRVLVLGWNHRVYQLANDLAAFTDERIELDIVSPVPVHEREAALELHAQGPDQQRLRHVVGDYTEETVLRRIDPGAYDNVLLLGNIWMASGDETDANTLLGYVLLRSVLREIANPPPILVELMNAGTAPLLARDAEVMISPVVVSHVLAHVAVRPELNAVMSELFSPGGAEIYFRSVSDLSLGGQSVTFDEIAHRSRRHGETCIGIRSGKQGVVLNPPRTRSWTFDGSEELVQIARFTS